MYLTGQTLVNCMSCINVNEFSQQFMTRPTPTVTAVEYVIRLHDDLTQVTVTCLAYVVNSQIVCKTIMYCNERNETFSFTLLHNLIYMYIM